MLLTNLRYPPPIYAIGSVNISYTNLSLANISINTVVAPYSKLIKPDIALLFKLRYLDECLITLASFNRIHLIE